MTKTRTLTVLAAAATLGLAAVAAPQPAEARHGGAIAAGVIGGVLWLRLRRVLLDPPTCLGWMGLAFPSRTSLWLRSSQIAESEA